MEKTITCSYDNLTLVPHDHRCDTKQSREFTFMLVYREIYERVWYNQICPTAWMRLFDTPQRKYLMKRGCTCCYDKLVKRCDVCETVEQEQYDELVHRGYSDSCRVSFDVPMCTYYWRINDNIESCLYKRLPGGGEYNFGAILLDMLNEDIEPLKKGRHIENVDQNNIVCGSTILRRGDERDGSVPHNSGNVLIDGREYLYEDVFA